MGFDLKRFIGEVDQEFECSICTMVLENPLQTPCDHLFCSECINNWLSVKKSCPVDSKPLTITDLKPINRSFRNLLNKFEIKCDFDSQGCNAVVKLEVLQWHLASCENNPDALIMCDKGCNAEISRREYQTSNCFTHLSINHKKEIASLIQELSNQKEQSARQGLEIERLSNELLLQKNQLENVANRKEKEIRKLSDKLHQLRYQQNQFEASMERQEQEIGYINERTKISLKPMKWDLSRNIKSPFHQPLVLERSDKSKCGFVRSFHAMEPKSSSFKVQVLNGEDFRVGLSFKGEISTEIGNWIAYYYNPCGALQINDVTEHSGSKCKIGDIIEIGIKFPLNFVNDGNASVELYLSINERVVTEKVIKMPVNAIYPTVQIYKDTKIKYLAT